MGVGAQRPGGRGWSPGGIGRTFVWSFVYSDGWTDRWTDRCSIGHHPLWVRYPKRAFTVKARKALCQ